MYNNEDSSAPPFVGDAFSMPALPPSYQSSINQNTNKPYNYSAAATDNNYLSREEKFRNIINKHEISLDFSQRLQQLQGFKIVFVFDDSGFIWKKIIY